MKIQMDNQVTTTDCRPGTIKEIQRRLTFPNPAYLENEKHGYSNYKTERLIRCYVSIPGGLSFPRGFIGQVLRIVGENGEPVSFLDERRTLPEVDFSFTGRLKPFQQIALSAVLKRSFGTLQAPTGSGKTVMALAIIAARRQPCIVVVHTKELLIQWIDRIETFLGIPKRDVGVISGGKMRIGNKITVALVQSLIKFAEDVVEHIGFLIVDECHRCPSKTFLDVVTRFDCKFMLGLSATPWRRDGLTRLIYFYLGDEVHKVDGQGLVDAGDICRAEVVTIQTDYQTRLDPATEYSRMLSELCEDEPRNELVVLSAIQESRNQGGIVLVLSDRKTHCNVLRSILLDSGIDSDVLTGDTTTKDRMALTDKFKAGNVRVLVATGQLIGEGFDLPEITSVILATPIKFSGRLIQYIGRALRPSPGKDCARIIDFCDARVSVLAAGARSRLRTFMGIPGATIAQDAIVAG